MPYYDYECQKCGKKFEAMQSIEEHDRHLAHDRREQLVCPECGSKRLEQLLADVHVITSKKS